MTTTFQQLKIIRHSAAYWRVSFDNPPINMLDARTVQELMQLLQLLETDQYLRVVVFDSANLEFFIAHFDTGTDMETILTPLPNGLFPWVDFVDRFAKLPVVTVAAIRGRARGVGSEFALACDIRFGSLEKAILAHFEVGAGAIPGGGALERLPRLVGRSRALEIILGAEDFDAATAERYGWINRAIPDAEFENFVDAYARRIASFDKQALAEAKRLINARSNEPPAALINDAHSTFLDSLTWPGTSKRVPKLMALGSGQRSDLELNFSRHVGYLDIDG